MFYLLSWFLVLGLLALWSLTAWAVHAVAVWSVSNASALTGVASGVEVLRLPEWLAPWVPPEIAQVMTSLLAGFAPVLTDGLTVVTWGVWGIGSLLLVLLGAGLHLLIAIWRRRGGGGGLPRRNW